MTGFLANLKRAMVVLVFLALALGPMLKALTHGPAAFLAEAD